MLSDNLKLKEERNLMVNELKKLQEAGLDNQENRSKWDELFTTVQGINNQIEANERSGKLEAMLANHTEDNVYRPMIDSRAKAGDKITAKDVEDSWRAFLLCGTPAQRPEFIKAANRCGILYNQLEYRHDVRGTSAQAVGSSSLGGYTTQDERISGFAEMLKAYGSLRNAATLLTTETDRDLPIPVVDATAEVGQIVAENGPLTVQDTAFQQIKLKCKKYNSDIIKLSFELIQDSQIPIVDYINKLVVTRLTRKMEADYALGGGTTESQGILVGAALGFQSTTGAAATSYNEMVEWLYSVDVAYRGRGSFMGPDAFVKMLAELVDGYGRPLLNPDLLRDGQNPVLFGKTFYVNNSFPVPADNVVCGVFGDLSAYHIRDVGATPRIVRLNELYAANDQVGITAYWQSWGQLIRGSSDTSCPVKSFQMKNV